MVKFCNGMASFGFVAWCNGMARHRNVRPGYPA
jgi:hypothetical protein